MRLTVLRTVVGIALAVGSLAACGSSTPETVEIGGQMTAKPGTVERPWGTVKTFPQLTKAQPPIDQDTRFATDMVMHHEQAVELSENVLTHDGTDERITAAANFIKQDQSNEITTMTAWLEAWQGATSHQHGGHHASGTTMPGMLPQADVDRIVTLTPTEAQVEFLRLMTIHHEGAVTMSQDYLAEGENAFTRATAQHIIREQQVEIDYFAHTIDELCAADPVAACPQP